MKRNSVEILAEISLLKDEAKALTGNCRREIRMLNDDETAKIADLKKQIAELQEELRALDVDLPHNVNIINPKSNKMEKRFSILNAIKGVAEGRQMDDLTAAVVDNGQKKARAAGINSVGAIVIPMSSEYRAVTVGTEGEDVVATDIMDVLTPLRSKNVLLQSGVKFLSGLKGDVQYPTMSEISASWEGEIAPTSDTTPTFGNVKLQPKRLSVVVPVSKQFLIQDSAAAEDAIRSEIVNAINGKLEATILGSAAGTATQPAGLFNASAALPTVGDFAALTSLEAAIEAANMDGYRYVCSPAAKALLRSMVKASGIGMVWENNEIDGRPVLTTSHVKGNGILVGDFSQMVLAQFGATDITVDTFTLAASGCVRLVVNSYWDFKVLRENAYKVANVSE